MRVVNLEELLGTVRLSKLEGLAATLALLKLIDEVRDTKRERVDEILAGAWSTIARIVTFGLRRPGWEVQLQLLQEWFNHRGDWAAMRRCLIEQGERAQGRPGELLELIDKHFARATAEYAQQFRDAK